jgi:hypothetical protein
MNLTSSFVESLEPRRLLAATLSGSVFNDANGNARRDSGEAGLANQRIFIDLNFDGAFQNNEPSVLSNSSGNYQFANRPNGIQRIRYVVPSGRRLSAPTRVFFDVPVTGVNVGNLIFGSTTTGVISGTVFRDANGNGRREVADIGLAGWTIFLDKDNDGVLDSGEQRVITDRNGNYRFAGLIPGTHSVRIVQQTGFTRTTPLNGLIRVTLASGQGISGRNFGQRLA